MVAFPPPLSEPVQRARPAGSAKKKRGVVAAPAAVPVCAKPANLVTTKVPTKPTAVVIAKRANYSRGEAAERMEAAVRDWLGKTGTYLELAGYTSSSQDQHLMARFCRLVRIPHETFRKYVVKDVDNRRALGKGVGSSCKSLIKTETTTFLTDTMRRRDRGDDGMTRRQGKRA